MALTPFFWIIIFFCTGYRPWFLTTYQEFSRNTASVIKIDVEKSLKLNSLDIASNDAS